MTFEVARSISPLSLFSPFTLTKEKIQSR